MRRAVDSPVAGSQRRAFARSMDHGTRTAGKSHHASSDSSRRLPHQVGSGHQNAESRLSVTATGDANTSVYQAVHMAMSRCAADYRAVPARVTLGVDGALSGTC